MNYLIFAYLLALVLPLFMRSWRASVAGLCLQALAMSAMIWLNFQHFSMSALLAFFDMALLRTLVAPSLLTFSAQVREDSDAFDLIAANLLIWSVALILLVLGFWFSNSLAGDNPGVTMHVGVACCGVLMALLILANQRSPLGQAIAILTLENAVALFELRSRHHVAVPVQIGLSISYFITIVIMTHLLRRMGAYDETTNHPADTAIL